MRTIKFKAKRVDTGEWVFGGITSPLHSPNGKIQIVSCEYHEQHEDEEDFIFIEVIPETVCQFTGLLDKNGVEIYEGDKIRYYTSTLETANIYTYDDVCFEAAAFMPFWVTQHTDQEGDPILYETIEVIGNIHDKP